MRLLLTGGQILAVRMAQVACNVAVGLLLARALGPAGQGRYSLTVAVATLAAAVLNGGIGLAAVPALRRGEVSLKRALAAQTLWITAAGVALLLLAGAAAAGPAARWTAAQFGWGRATAFAAASAAVALLAFDVLVYDLLGSGRLVAGGAVQLLRAALQLIALTVALAGGALGLGAAVTIFAAAQAAGASLLLALLARDARRGAAEPSGRPAAAPSAARLAGQLARRGWTGQISAVASLLHLRLDLALIAAWHGAAAVGVYSVAVLLGELLWHLPSALSPVLVFSSAAPGGADGARRDHLAARAVRVGVVGVAAAALPLGLAAGWLVPRLFGTGFAGAALALRCLLPGIVAYAAGTVLAGDFIGRGRPAWNAQGSLLTVALSLAAGLLLIPRGGIVGAAWASSLAYTGGAAWMIVRFRRATGLTWRDVLLVRRGG